MISMLVVLLIAATSQARGANRPDGSVLSTKECHLAVQVSTQLKSSDCTVKDSLIIPPRITKIMESVKAANISVYHVNFESIFFFILVQRAIRFLRIGLFYLRT